MKKIVLFAFFVSSLGMGQEISDYIKEQDSAKKVHRYLIYDSDYTIAPIETQFNFNLYVVGSPYFESKWEKGVVFINKRPVLNAPMRYNAEREIIEFYEEDLKRKDIIPKPFIEVRIADVLYKYMEYAEAGTRKWGYFNPLMKEGDLKLYYRPIKKITDPIMGNSWSRFWEPRCINVSDYYLGEVDQPLQRVNLNQKYLLPLLSDNTPEIEQFISRNELNLRKEKDVISLLEYYNQLKKQEVVPKNSFSVALQD